MKNKIFNYKTFSWKKYVFETLSIFIAVVSAFSLNNWNQNMRDHTAEREILKEMKNAIENDINTLEHNKARYIFGKKSCAYLRDLIDNKPVNQDSIQDYYNSIFADPIFTANKTGYDGLVTKGLDILKDDLLRKRISYYYNYYFNILGKLESENEQMQAYKNYFFPINNVLVGYMEFDDEGLLEIKQPINISELDKKKMYSYLWNLESNKEYKITIYTHFIEQIKVVEEHITKTLEEMD